MVLLYHFGVDHKLKGKPALNEPPGQYIYTHH